MNGLVLLGLVCGIGCALGAWLLIVPAPQPMDATPPAWVARVTAQLSRRRLAGAVVAALLVGAVTRWPVGALLAGAAALYLPVMLGPDRAGTHAVARIEAVAGWTEQLRDTLSAAAGLEQAIIATAATTPEPIRREVAELVARLERRERLPHALAVFADQLADPLGDLVVAALSMAAQRQARQLAPLLGDLAAQAREQASMRLRVAADRASTRTSVRMITAITLGMATALAVFDRSFLSPYDSAAGQLLLLLVGAIFVAGFALLARIARMPEPPRVLTRTSVGADDRWAARR